MDVLLWLLVRKFNTRQEVQSDFEGLSDPQKNVTTVTTNVCAIGNVGGKTAQHAVSGASGVMTADFSSLPA